MKPSQFASLSLAISLAAFTAGAQTPAAPPSPEVGSGNRDAQYNQDAQPLPSGDQWVDKAPAPSSVGPRQSASSPPQQETTPSLPGTANENKADPTDQNNPK